MKHHKASEQAGYGVLFIMGDGTQFVKKFGPQRVLRDATLSVGELFVERGVLQAVIPYVYSIPVLEVTLNEHA